MTISDLTTRPASREELQELVSVLYERLRDAKDAGAALRKWAAAMPALPATGMIRVGELNEIEAWMRERPETHP